MLLLSSARICLKQWPLWWPRCGLGPLIKEGGFVPTHTFPRLWVFFSFSVVSPSHLRDIRTFSHDVLQRSVSSLGQVFILSLLQLSRKQKTLWSSFPLKTMASFSRGGAVLLGFSLSCLASSILPWEWLPPVARTALKVK